MRTLKLKNKQSNLPKAQKLKEAKPKTMLCLLMSGPALSTEPQSLTEYHYVIAPEVRLLKFKPSFPPY